MIDLERVGAVFVLRMKAGENRFTPPFLAALGEALDEVEASAGPAALVLTGEGKFFSNGLDLVWMRGQDPREIGPFVASFQALLARVLAFPLPSVAALNGHAFAGGAMFALACDFRVMRADRGFFCIPEIDLGLPLAPGMASLIQSKLSKLAAHEAIVTGRRYGGAEAEARGIVHFAVPEVDLLPKSIALAAPLAGKNRAIMQTHKRLLYGEALLLLEG